MVQNWSGLHLAPDLLQNIEKRTRSTDIVFVKQEDYTSVTLTTIFYICNMTAHADSHHVPHLLRRLQCRTVPASHKHPDFSGVICSIRHTYATCRGLCHVWPNFMREINLVRQFGFCHQSVRQHQHYRRFS